MSCALDWPTPVASLANPEIVAISLPISQYKGLGFVNFIQGFTFPCGELQSRYLLKVFKGEVVTPSLEEQVLTHLPFLQLPQLLMPISLTSPQLRH